MLVLLGDVAVAVAVAVADVVAVAVAVAAAILLLFRYLSNGVPLHYTFVREKTKIRACYRTSRSYNTKRPDKA